MRMTVKNDGLGYQVVDGEGIVWARADDESQLALEVNTMIAKQAEQVEIHRDALNDAIDLLTSLTGLAMRLDSEVDECHASELRRARGL